MMGRKFDRTDFDSSINGQAEEMLAQLRMQLEQQSAEMVRATIDS